MSFTSFDPARLSPEQCHKLSIGTIVPRPIAWTTSVDAEGRANLAPFSYFMGCHSYVPALAISIGSRGDQPKDSRANIAASGEFVVNMVTAELVEACNISAAAFPPEIDEIEVLGLETLPSEAVAPPRIAAAPVQIECRVLHAIDLGAPPRLSTLFVGQVLRWHVREDLVIGDAKVDQAALGAVGRMGGPYYAHARELFSLSIPDWREVLAMRTDADSGRVKD
jgi:flavin reductase (DIM6/NTAB) family NADH-FMN oxidoreductase RutF